MELVDYCYRKLTYLVARFVQAAASWNIPYRVLWSLSSVCSEPEKIQPVERAAKAILEESREQVRA